MKNNNRLYNLLAAGSLTILLALTFFLFRGNGFGTAVGAANTWTGTTPAVVTSAQTDNATQANVTQDPALNTLQAQNAKLTQMLQVMQEREKQYQTQLNTATQALQANQAQSAPSYEGGESHGHEYGEHEEGEHEGFAWFGEHGDDD